MTVLSYLLSTLPFLVALALGLLVPIVLILLYRNFGAGLFLVMLSFMVDTLTLGTAAINLGINLFFPDLTFLLLAFTAALRFFFAKDFPRKNVAWFAFVFLVIISTVTGIASFGSSGGVQARSYFYFVVAGSYAMSFRMSDEQLRSIFNALVVCTLLLIGTAFYRWVVYYTPITSLLPPGGTYNIDGAIRVIYSNHALVIAQVMVAAFFFALAAGGFALSQFLSPLLLGMVIVLQHRSVWLAAMVGVLARFLLGNTKSGSTVRQLVFVAAIAAITAVPLAFNQGLSSVTQQVGNSAAGALSGGGTGGERLQSWGEIVKNWYGAGARSIVIGQSFGSDNTRTVTDSRGESKQISYIAHNLYVQTLFNTGLLGLAAYLIACIYVVLGLYRICRTTRDNVLAEVLFVLIVMQMAYYVPYGVDYLQALLFGAALAYVAENRIPSAKELRKKNLLGQLQS